MRSENLGNSFDSETKSSSPDQVQDESSPTEDIDKQLELKAGQTLLESTLLYLRKPSKKMKIFLAFTAFFLGLGSQSSRILQAYYNYLLTNPASIRYNDICNNREYASGKPVIQDLPDRPFQEGEFSSVDFLHDDARISLIPDMDNLQREGFRDKKPKIEIENEVIRNLITNCLEYVDQPEDEAAFRLFVEAELSKHFQYSETNAQRFQEGDIANFVNIACQIVIDNIEYHKTTSSVIEGNSSGKMKYKIGRNPIKSYMDINSSGKYDGLPVDKLLMHENVGVCRHFADSLTLVSEEIKKIHPDKFQNIYIIPYTSSYRNHRYNMAIYLKNPKDAAVFSLEPQTNKLENPSFEVIKTMYNRNLVSKDQYYEIITKLLSSSGLRESNADLFAIAMDAEYDKRPDVAKLAKEVILAQAGFETLSIMFREKSISESEYALGIARLLASRSILSSIEIENLLSKISSLKGDNQKIVLHAVKNHFADNSKHNEPAFNYIKAVFSLYDQKIYTYEELIQICEKFFIDYETSGLESYMEILLKNGNYNLVEKHLNRQINNLFQNFEYFYNEEPGRKNYLTNDDLIRLVHYQKNRLYKDNERFAQSLKKATGKDLMTKFNHDFNNYIDRVVNNRQK